MKTTIDKAGRLVIPKTLRDKLGLVPGRVEVEVDGAALKVLPLADEGLETRGGLLVIPSSGVSLNDDEVRALREADQR
ncbi:MAG: AbrB/MazE/SpoVT family DNA-binding domain-containing protein [Actinomycetota bacterium]